MPEVVSEDEKSKILGTKGPTFKPIAGTEKKKSPFTADQNKLAGFAVRMENALRIIEDLEKRGFNPRNTRDYLLQNFPVLGDTALTYIFQSPEFKQYERAALDFMTAQLRFETGAVIAESEIEWVDLTYFPKLGDDPVTLGQRADSRRTAFEAIKGGAGKAYDEVKKSMGTIDDSTQEQLIKKFYTDEKFRNEIISRAKNNPQTYANMIGLGLFTGKGSIENPEVKPQ